MPAARGRLTVKDVPALLQALTCGDAVVQQRTLGVLCPCQNRVYNISIWREIFRVYDEASVGLFVRNQPEYEPVRDRAAHAIQTLHEFSRTEAEAQCLLDSLRAEGIDTMPDSKRKPERQQSQRLAMQHLQAIEDTLACGTHEDQKELLTALCPCRNRRYDQNVWAAIFRSAHDGETGAIRDQAHHAIGTLMERARTDPRTQELLLKLREQGAVSQTVEDSIPTWRPNLRGNGLYIPRFQHSPRSKTNRRR